jgi:hypothetical protein
LLTLSRGEGMDKNSRLRAAVGSTESRTSASG